MSEYELMIDNSEEIRELRKEYIQTETEYAELKIKYAELKQKYDELNDFSNSQLAKVLKENEELKEQIEQLKERIKEVENDSNNCEHWSFIKIKLLEEQIEKMKCCGNCDNNAYCEKEHYGNDKGCKDWELADEQTM